MVGGLRVRPRIDPRWVRTDGSRDCRGGPRDDRSAAGSDIPHSSSRAHRDRGGAVNPADLEILQTGLSFIPEEMGVALRRTAYSPNIKERMDASCALFDAEGRIVAQAEHIPVHLGSMPVAVDAAMRDFPGTLREGDQIILNDPYRGGTHLPDVTLIRPVFVRQLIIGFAVNRAHHADIGGRVPGSMPATAMRLEDEGLVLEPQKVMDRGRERQAVVERFRQETMYPAERLGDLRALNAPFAVPLSATSYVMRCLTDPDAPRNAGALRPLRVLAKEGSLVRPRPPAAVAAGNVETSQRIVDVLFLALSEPLAETVPAQSQGTMNNVTIGGPDPRPFSYYETIAGGEGALPYRPGMAGVHTHMTNTRNTPIEALEFAYPLRIEEYRLIPGTGGRGQHSGGDGIRRSVRLLARKGTASILSERRALRPKGLEGGDDGRPGKNLLVRRGRRHRLPAKVTLELRRGDLLVIETPGGGGWGPPERRRR